MDLDKKPLIRLYEDSGDNSETGKIVDNQLLKETGRSPCHLQVANKNQIAGCSVQGLNRRWDFGWDYGLLDEKSAPYAFLISPAGHGLYYDFTIKNTTSPSQIFQCKARN